MKITVSIPKVMVADDEAYRWAFSSLLCAALALVIAPAVLVPLGVAVGTVAVWKGGGWWGAAGISGSAVALVISYYVAAGVVA